MGTGNIIEEIMIEEIDKIFEGLSSGQAIEILWSSSPLDLGYVAERFSERKDSCVLVSESPPYFVMVHKCPERLG